jgi:hypothetical protein
LTLRYVTGNLIVLSSDPVSLNVVPSKFAGITVISSIGLNHEFSFGTQKADKAPMDEALGTPALTLR